MIARGDAFVRETFFFIVQAAGTDGLPPPMRNKLICAKSFNLRSETVGDRLTPMIKTGLFDTFVPSWNDFGPYKVEWGSDDRAVKIIHVSGAEALIKGEGEFTMDFSTHCWHSDNEAYVKGQRLSRFTMKDYFLENEGPNLSKLLPDTLAKHASDAEATVEKIKLELSKDEVKALYEITLWKVSVHWQTIGYHLIVICKTCTNALFCIYRLTHV